ncbi:MAG: alpha/beta fold hydrolase [Saprospiraceae bacterium]|nr:alpha/beta fold hydrolase [Saprospiraceae bacterium]
MTVYNGFIRPLRNLIITAVAVLIGTLSAQPLFSQNISSLKQDISTDTLQVDAGGFKLYMLKKGNKKGLTVIMENGLCGTAHRWNKLDDSISVNHTVVTYDRAFVGKSEKGNPDRRAEIVSKELKTALNNAQISGPYVLIGYSLGGYYVKAFARSYPNEVKGILLIDPLNSAEFYREYKINFPENYELDISPLKDIKAEHPCYNEISFAVNETVYGNDSVPLRIPTYMLISSLAQDTASLLQSVKEYENGKSLDTGKLINGNIKLQKLWVKHQLKWASAFANVKTEVTNECTHGMHHERFDIIWRAFQKLMEEVAK